MAVHNLVGGWAGIVGVFVLLAGVWLPIETHLNLEPTPWLKSGLLILLGIYLLSVGASRLSSAVKLKKLSKGKVDEF
jgi:nitrate/nitrite transporter NarK